VEAESVQSFSPTKQRILTSAVATVFQDSNQPLQADDITLVMSSADHRQLSAADDVIRTHQLAIAESMNIDLSAVEIHVSGTARHLLGGITIDVLMAVATTAGVDAYEHTARAEGFMVQLVAELQRNGIDMRLHLSSVGTEDSSVPPESISVQSPEDVPVLQEESTTTVAYIISALSALLVIVVGIFLYKKLRRESPTMPSGLTLKSPMKSPTRKLKTHKIYVHGEGSDEGEEAAPRKELRDLRSSLKQPRAAFNLNTVRMKKDLQDEFSSPPRAEPASLDKTPDLNVDVRSETESEVGSPPEVSQLSQTDQVSEMDLDNQAFILAERMRQEGSDEDDAPATLGPPLWIANTWTSSTEEVKPEN